MCVCARARVRERERARERERESRLPVLFATLATTSAVMLGVPFNARCSPPVPCTCMFLKETGENGNPVIRPAHARARYLPLPPPPPPYRTRVSARPEMFKSTQTKICLFTRCGCRGIYCMCYVLQCMCYGFWHNSTNLNLTVPPIHPHPRMSHPPPSTPVCRCQMPNRAEGVLESELSSWSTTFEVNVLGTCGGTRGAQWEDRIVLHGILP